MSGIDSFGVVPLKREGHTFEIDPGYTRQEGEEPEFDIEENVKPMDSTMFVGSLQIVRSKTGGW